MFVARTVVHVFIFPAFYFFFLLLHVSVLYFALVANKLHKIKEIWSTKSPLCVRIDVQSLPVAGTYSTQGFSSTAILKNVRNVIETSLHRADPRFIYRSLCCNQMQQTVQYIHTYKTV